MSLITSGRIVGLAVLIIVCGAIYYFLYRAERGNPPNIRRLPQVDAIDELIARAVEMNREFWFIPGGGVMTNAFVLPGILSVFGILAYVTQKCAEYGAQLYCYTRNPIGYNIQAEIMREAYELAGKPEEYDPVGTIVYFPSGSLRPYLVQGVQMRRPASAILMGAWYHQTIIFCEALQRAGAMTLGGTDTTHNIPFMVAANNYSTIGEEMYAMSAYLSEDPVLGSTLAGQDIGKYAAMIITIIGVLLAAAGMPVADWLVV
jgi:uncharacterized membrane protein YccF (DUF307 family)